MKIRHYVGAAVCAGTIIGFGGSAFAGEWAPGNGETPIREHVANSNCAFSGAEESDETEDHGDHEGDDDLWASTPAGGKAQSPGQIIALFGAGAAAPGSIDGPDYPYDTCRGWPSLP